MSARPATDTRTRLLRAAATCFAARGFHGTTIREIAEHAGVNVAAGHYHVGSKRDLYLAVLREQFALVQRRVEAGGAAVDVAALDHAGRDELETLLRRRLRVMLRFLLGPPPSVHGTLMQREMLDPSEALPVIVREFVEPFTVELRGLLARLAPSLGDAEIERATLGILGQALFYRFAMPVVLARWGRRAYSPALARTLADQIVDFSLGGLARLEAAHAAHPEATRAGRPRRRARGR